LQVILQSFNVKSLACFEKLKVCVDCSVHTVYGLFVYLSCMCLWMQLFEFSERVSGARMHTAYIRPGGVSQVISCFQLQLLFSGVYFFLQVCSSSSHMGLLLLIYRLTSDKISAPNVEIASEYWFD